MESRQAQIRGVRLHWYEAGAGEAVLLLHAFPLSARMWTPQLEGLSPSRRWIAPDFRGFGSSGAGSEPFSMELFADDVAALLDHLGLERAALCGLSMGGYVAFAFWRHHRERIERLVLADTRAGADDGPGRMRRRLASEEVRQRGAAAVPRLLLDRLLAAETRRTNARVTDGVLHMLEEVAPQSFIRAQKAMGYRPDSSPIVDEIEVPALVIVGEHDPLGPVQEARVLADELPQGRLEVIPGAGHLPNLERPDHFNRLLGEFLP